ncbi:hypothetical protein PV11_02617 [Exophiala sideris]|uniref:Uncharacterized protein n=1 Tax=Exophiala sideris TaxID=1016849 RepID=A0A0D1XG33_9EURO|nr:hypothetical protein PV11_02617 [Exophiala sideris]
MSAMDIDTLWRTAFGESTRPVLYSSAELNEDGFQPLNDPQSFIMNITTLKRKQLFAASANNQIAMKLAQDEYIELERQITRLKGKETSKNPQDLPAPGVFEERKESALYGYKYEPNKPALLGAGIPGLRSADDLSEREKNDVRLFQEPFEQGGFVPKEREYKAMVARARNPKNIDGWDPVIKNGKALIPKQQVHRDEYSITYVKRNVNENGEIERPQSAGSDVTGLTPSKVVDKRLTRTRFDGQKVPPTRDVSEAPSSVSTTPRKRANTPADNVREETPTAKRRKVTEVVPGVVRPKHPNQYTKGLPGYGKVPPVQVQSRPKHPNQYTKAKELAARNAAEATATASQTASPAARDSPRPVAPTSSWRGLSPQSLRNRKWTDEELVEAVKHDHLWLHDDPNKAEDWKNKIINGINPVRSFSMFRKWAYWRDENKDKRPRAKKNLPDDMPQDVKESTESPRPRRAAAAKPSKADSARTTPATTPVPETFDGGWSQESKAAGGGSGRSARRGGLGINMLMNHDSSPDELHEDINVERASGRYAATPPQYGRQVSSPMSKASLKKEDTDSDSMIVVNGTPDPPRRRSVRNLRRSSG